jgi:cytochrome oxidase Cu insertion factor (SCO1/SenC/PrrC family)
MASILFITINPSNAKNLLWTQPELLSKIFYELNYIHSIRWIASEYQAISKVFKNYRVIVNNMVYIKNSNDFSDDISQKAKYYLETCKIQDL